MFGSNFASMIDRAVNDCVLYASGRETATMETDPGKFSTVTVEARWSAYWTDDDENIEVCIYENQVLRFSYIERVPDKYK